MYRQLLERPKASRFGAPPPSQPNDPVTNWIVMAPLATDWAMISALVTGAGTLAGAPPEDTGAARSPQAGSSGDES